MVRRDGCPPISLRAPLVGGACRPPSAPWGHGVSPTPAVSPPLTWPAVPPAPWTPPSLSIVSTVAFTHTHSLNHSITPHYTHTHPCTALAKAHTHLVSPYQHTSTQLPNHATSYLCMFNLDACALYLLHDYPHVLCKYLLSLSLSFSLTLSLSLSFSLILSLCSHEWAAPAPSNFQPIHSQ